METIKLQDQKSDQQPDSKEGYYFVSVIDGDRWMPLLGGFKNNHAEALKHVDAVNELAQKLDYRATWYGFGTCRMDENRHCKFNDRPEFSHLLPLLQAVDSGEMML